MALYPVLDFVAGTHDQTEPRPQGGLHLASGTSEGTWTSPVLEAAPFDWAVASWNGSGDRLEVLARVCVGDNWSPWFSFGQWSSTGSKASVNGQKHPGFGWLSTDTLLLDRTVTRYQLQVHLQRAKLQRLWWTAVEAAQRLDDPPCKAAWGKDLPVPQQSQMVFPHGGNVWCSPTSLTMVMSYWGYKESVPEKAVPGVYDEVYDGHGNWPFNTAYASTRGFVAYVDRFQSFAGLERMVAAGIPVIASVAYNQEWLANAPIPKTNGHILVVRGFTDTGDVIVNDPAAQDSDQVCQVYRRDLFRRAWLDRGGVVYMIYPPEKSI